VAHIVTILPCKLFQQISGTSSVVPTGLLLGLVRRLLPVATQLRRHGEHYVKFRNVGSGPLTAEACLRSRTGSRFTSWLVARRRI